MCGGFFLKDVALNGVPFGTAEFLGPVRGQPALGVQNGMPFLLTRFAQFIPFANFIAHFLGQLFLKKGAHFGAECLFFVAIAQIH